MTARTLLDFENAILDLFEKNRITIQDAKTVLWTLLTAIYEDELVEEPQRREIIISNIERQKEQLLVNILGPPLSLTHDVSNAVSTVSPC
jgi:hypothetical protein